MRVTIGTEKLPLVLAICTTDYNDGILNSGISRFTSKDFARALRDNLVTDLTAQFGEFGKRYLWDRNYSETRLPEVPSAILEMLSHQNFPDMRIAQDRSESSISHAPSTKLSCDS